MSLHTVACQGVPYRLGALPESELRALQAQLGPTVRLPLGPEGRVAPSRVPSNDCLADDISGDGVAFEAAEPALYGRHSL